MGTEGYRQSRRETGDLKWIIAVAPSRVESMLKEIKRAPGLEGRLTGTILDQGDAVGAWQGDGVAVVVFPTPETLKKVRI